MGVASLLRVAWTLCVFAAGASGFSLMKHDTSPLFTKSFQVHSLSAANYDMALKDRNKVWLVDYYAPWCPHCRHFAPEWEKVANFYAGTDTVQVGAVDCTKNGDICNREGIRGYPGVKVHHVPADAEKAVLMPQGVKNARVVIGWVEKQLEEHGMKSGVSAEDIAAQLKLLRNDQVVRSALRAGEKQYNDHSLEIKYRRLHDAGVAAVSTFRNGFFVGANVLEGERYDAALLWVEALATSFPLKKNRAALVMLAEAMKQSHRWDRGEWNGLLKKWQDTANERTFPLNLFRSSDDEGYAFCETYTCGLWTLFHSITLSNAKTTAAGEPWKPSKTMAAIRLYVKHFFGCEECREHFMASNPESIVDELAQRDAEGPAAVSMWIWTMHNTVNKVLKKDQWPSKRDCPVCYVDDGEPISLDPTRLHEEEIVSYTASAYGYSEDDVYAMDAAYNGTIAALWSSMRGFSALVVLIVLSILLAVAFKTRKQRIITTKVIRARDHTA